MEFQIIETETSRRITELTDLGNEYLSKFPKLVEDGWRFELSSHKTLLGQCQYRKKLIVFSWNFQHIPQSEIVDTILHEIAHALVGPAHGHDDVWRNKCLEIGARPIRCAPRQIKSSAKHNYYIKCEVCGKRWNYFRRPNHRTFHAKHCGQEIKVYKIGG